MQKVISSKNEQGTTLVEFAAVLVVLLTLTFGMIDFARYVYTISAVRSAVQEGARSALSLDNSIEVATAAAKNKMVALDIDLATVNIVRDTEMVDAVVTYSFEFITPLVVAVVPNSTVVVSSTVSMMIY